MSVTVTFRGALQPQQYRERKEARMLRGRHFTSDTQAIMNHISTAPKGFIFLLVSRAGLEPGGHSEHAQLIDSIKRHKRQNRSFRRSEVHGRYTACESVTTDT